MKSKNINLILIGALTVLFISACASRLDSLSPKEADLSGHWILDKEASQTVSLFSVGRAQQSNAMGGGGMGGGMGGGGQQGAEQEASEASSRRSGGLALTPAMKSTEMTIEQNHDSMGIAYPNELYRDIDWGRKEFFRETVNAGWQENNLIVISASDQMTITETYQLNSTADILNLTISIRTRNGTNEFVRVFNQQK